MLYLFLAKVASGKKLPIALVKYNNVVYHCERVNKTICGHSIDCGKLSVHCAQNLVIEKLRK